MPQKTSLATAACVAIAACAFAAAPVDAGAGQVLLQLTPAQDFTPSDGRAMDVPAWRINGAIAERVIAAFNAAQPPVIDYEHQTLHKEANGQPAPAAGWMHSLRWVEGQGLFAQVELTERARGLVQAGEYRYFSPVFEYARGSGEVTRILMGALTNHPAIAGMEAVNLTAAASARFGAAPTPLNHTPAPETATMNELLKKLLAALGLPEDTGEEEALKALDAMKTQLDATHQELGLDDKADAPAVAAACARLRTQGADPALFVPVAAVRELQTQVAALTAQSRTRQVDDLVAPALQDGRLLPALEVWARELGGKDVAALSAYLAAAQPVAALTGTQTRGRAPQGNNPHGLSDDEMAVAVACGMTPEAYASGRSN
jgi:phage I-like protein